MFFFAFLGEVIPPLTFEAPRRLSFDPFCVASSVAYVETVGNRSVGSVSVVEGEN